MFQAECDSILRSQEEDLSMSIQKMLINEIESIDFSNKLLSLIWLYFFQPTWILDQLLRASDLITSMRGAASTAEGSCLSRGFWHLLIDVQRFSDNWVWMTLSNMLRYCQRLRLPSGACRISSKRCWSSWCTFSSSSLRQRLGSFWISSSKTEQGRNYQKFIEILHK